MRSRPILKTIALLTCVLFTLTQGVSADVAATITSASSSSALRTPEITQPLFQIPSEFGYVRDQQGADPTFFLIQDAHGQEDAQKNIKKILEHLYRTASRGDTLNSGQANVSPRDAVRMQVFIEGGVGELNPDYLRFFEEEKFNLKAAEYLQREGEIGGPELFLLENVYRPSSIGDRGKNDGRQTIDDRRFIKAYGVEDPELFVQNIYSFGKVKAQSSVSDFFLNSLRGQISKEASVVFSAKLFKFFKAWLRFEDDTSDLLAYFSILKETSKDALSVDLRLPESQLDWPMLVRFFELQNRESKLDRELANKERSELLAWAKENKIDPMLVSYLENDVKRYLNEMVEGLGEEFIKLERSLEGRRGFWEKFYLASKEKGFNFSNYPYLSVFEGFQILQGEMDSRALMEEAEKLHAEILDSFARTDEEKALVSKVHDYLLLKKLFHLELTRGDFDALQERVESKGTGSDRDRFVAEGQESNLSRSRTGTSSQAPLLPNDVGENLDQLFQEALRFYEVALKRDEVMMDVVLGTGSAAGQVFFSSENQKPVPVRTGTSVLISGGFHTRGITERLEREGVDYAVISPTMSQIESDEKYVAASTGEKTLLDLPKFTKRVTNWMMPLNRLSGFPDNIKDRRKEILTQLRDWGTENGATLRTQPVTPARSESRGSEYYFSEEAGKEPHFEAMRDILRNPPIENKKIPNGHLIFVKNNLLSLLTPRPDNPDGEGRDGRISSKPIVNLPEDAEIESLYGRAATEEEIKNLGLKRGTKTIVWTVQSKNYDDHYFYSFDTDEYWHAERFTWSKWREILKDPPQNNTRIPFPEYAFGESENSPLRKKTPRPSDPDSKVLDSVKGVGFPHGSDKTIEYLEARAMTLEEKEELLIAEEAPGVIWTFKAAGYEERYFYSVGGDEYLQKDDFTFNAIREILKDPPDEARFVPRGHIATRTNDHRLSDRMPLPNNPDAVFGINTYTPVGPLPDSKIVSLEGRKMTNQEKAALGIDMRVKKAIVWTFKFEDGSEPVSFYSFGTKSYWKKDEFTFHAMRKILRNLPEEYVEVPNPNFVFSGRNTLLGKAPLPSNPSEETVVTSQMNFVPRDVEIKAFHGRAMTQDENIEVGFKAYAEGVIWRVTDTNEQMYYIYSDGEEDYLTKEGITFREMRRILKSPQPKNQHVPNPKNLFQSENTLKVRSPRPDDPSEQLGVTGQVGLPKKAEILTLEGRALTLQEKEALGMKPATVGILWTVGMEDYEPRYFYSFGGKKYWLESEFALRVMRKFLKNPPKEFSEVDRGHLLFRKLNLPSKAMPQPLSPDAKLGWGGDASFGIPKDAEVLTVQARAFTEAEREDRSLSSDDKLFLKVIYREENGLHGAKYFYTKGSQYVPDKKLNAKDYAGHLRLIHLVGQAKWDEAADYYSENMWRFPVFFRDAVVASTVFKQFVRHPGVEFEGDAPLVEMNRGDDILMVSKGPLNQTLALVFGPQNMPRVVMEDVTPEMHEAAIRTERERRLGTPSVRVLGNMLASPIATNEDSLTVEGRALYPKQDEALTLNRFKLAFLTSKPHRFTDALGNTRTFQDADMAKAVREIRRKMTPGGVLVIPADGRRFTLPYLESMTKLGFEPAMELDTPVRLTDQHRLQLNKMIPELGDAIAGKLSSIQSQFMVFRLVDVEAEPGELDVLTFPLEETAEPTVDERIGILDFNPMSSAFDWTNVPWDAVSGVWMRGEEPEAVVKERKHKLKQALTEGVDERDLTKAHESLQTWIQNIEANQSEISLLFSDDERREILNEVTTLAVNRILDPNNQVGATSFAEKYNLDDMKTSRAPPLERFRNHIKQGTPVWTAGRNLLGPKTLSSSELTKLLLKLETTLGLRSEARFGVVDKSLSGVYFFIRTHFGTRPTTLGDILRKKDYLSESALRKKVKSLRDFGLLEYDESSSSGRVQLKQVPSDKLNSIRFVLSQYEVEFDKPYVLETVQAILANEFDFQKVEDVFDYKKEAFRLQRKKDPRADYAGLYLTYRMLKQRYSYYPADLKALISQTLNISDGSMRNYVRDLEALGLLEVYRKEFETESDGTHFRERTWVRIKKLGRGMQSKAEKLLLDYARDSKRQGKHVLSGLMAALFAGDDLKPYTEELWDLEDIAKERALLFPPVPEGVKLGPVKLTLQSLVETLWVMESEESRPNVTALAARAGVLGKQIRRFSEENGVNRWVLLIKGITIPASEQDFRNMIKSVVERMRTGDERYRYLEISFLDFFDAAGVSPANNKISEKGKAFGLNQETWISEFGLVDKRYHPQARVELAKKFLESLGLDPDKDENVNFVIRRKDSWSKASPEVRRRVIVTELEWRQTLRHRLESARNAHIRDLIQVKVDEYLASRDGTNGEKRTGTSKLKALIPGHPLLINQADEVKAELYEQQAAERLQELEVGQERELKILEEEVAAAQAEIDAVFEAKRAAVKARKAKKKAALERKQKNYVPIVAPPVQITDAEIRVQQAVGSELLALRMSALEDFETYTGKAEIFIAVFSKALNTIKVDSDREKVIRWARKQFESNLIGTAFSKAEKDKLNRIFDTAVHPVRSESRLQEVEVAELEELTGTRTIYAHPDVYPFAVLNRAGGDPLYEQALRFAQVVRRKLKNAREILETKETPRILIVGAGSGIDAMAALKELLIDQGHAGLQLDLVDLDPEAIQLAEVNLLEQLKSLDQRFSRENIGEVYQEITINRQAKVRFFPLSLKTFREAQVDLEKYDFIFFNAPNVTSDPTFEIDNLIYMSEDIFFDEIVAFFPELLSDGGVAVVENSVTLYLDLEKRAKSLGIDFKIDKRRDSESSLPTSTRRIFDLTKRSEMRSQKQEVDKLLEELAQRYDLLWEQRVKFMSDPSKESAELGLQLVYQAQLVLDQIEERFKSGELEEKEFSNSQRIGLKVAKVGVPANNELFATYLEERWQYSAEEVREIYSKFNVAQMIETFDGGGELTSRLSLSLAVRSPLIMRDVVSRIVRRLTPGGRILSVGAGTGDLEKLLSLAGYEITFIEQEESFVELLKQKKLTGFQGDAHQLPKDLLSQSFDAILFSESIGVLDPPKAIREVTRVLKPGGQIFLTTYPASVNIRANATKYLSPSAERLQSYLPEGFSDIQVETISRQALNDPVELRGWGEGDTLLYFMAVTYQPKRSEARGEDKEARELDYFVNAMNQLRIISEFPLKDEMDEDLKLLVERLKQLALFAGVNLEMIRSYDVDSRGTAIFGDFEDLKRLIRSQPDEMLAKLEYDLYSPVNQAIRYTDLGFRTEPLSVVERSFENLRNLATELQGREDVFNVYEQQEVIWIFKRIFDYPQALTRAYLFSEDDVELGDILMPRMQEPEAWKAADAVFEDSSDRLPALVIDLQTLEGGFEEVILMNQEGIIMKHAKTELLEVYDGLLLPQPRQIKRKVSPYEKRYFKIESLETPDQNILKGVWTLIEEAESPQQVEARSLILQSFSGMPNDMREPWIGAAIYLATTSQAERLSLLELFGVNTNYLEVKLAISPEEFYELLREIDQAGEVRSEARQEREIEVPVIVRSWEEFVEAVLEWNEMGYEPTSMVSESGQFAAFQGIPESIRDIAEGIALSAQFLEGFKLPFELKLLEVHDEEGNILEHFLQSAKIPVFYDGNLRLLGLERLANSVIYLDTQTESLDQAELRQINVIQPKVLWVLNNLLDHPASILFEEKAIESADDLKSWQLLKTVTPPQSENEAGQIHYHLAIESPSYPDQVWLLSTNGETWGVDSKQDIARAGYYKILTPQFRRSETREREPATTFVPWKPTPGAFQEVAARDLSLFTLLDDWRFHKEPRLLLYDLFPMTATLGMLTLFPFVLFQPDKFWTAFGSGLGALVGIYGFFKGHFSRWTGKPEPLLETKNLVKRFFYKYVVFESLVIYSGKNALQTIAKNSAVSSVTQAELDFLARFEAILPSEHFIRVFGDLGEWLESSAFGQSIFPGGVYKREDRFASMSFFNASSNPSTIIHELVHLFQFQAQSGNRSLDFSRVLQGVLKTLIRHEKDASNFRNYIATARQWIKAMLVHYKQKDLDHEFLAYFYQKVFEADFGSRERLLSSDELTSEKYRDKFDPRVVPYQKEHQEIHPAGAEIHKSMEAFTQMILNLPEGSARTEVFAYLRGIYSQFHPEFPLPPSLEGASAPKFRSEVRNGILRRFFYEGELTPIDVLALLNLFPEGVIEEGGLTQEMESDVLISRPVGIAEAYVPKPIGEDGFYLNYFREDGALMLRLITEKEGEITDYGNMRFIYTPELNQLSIESGYMPFKEMSDENREVFSGFDNPFFGAWMKTRVIPWTERYGIDSLRFMRGIVSAEDLERLGFESRSGIEWIHEPTRSEARAGRTDVSYLKKRMTDLKYPKVLQGKLEKILRNSRTEFSELAVENLLWISLAPELPKGLKADEVFHAILQLSSKKIRGQTKGTQGVGRALNAVSMTAKETQAGFFGEIIYAYQLQQKGFDVLTLDTKVEPNVEIDIVLRTGNNRIILVEAKTDDGLSQKRKMTEVLERKNKQYKKVIDTADFNGRRLLLEDYPGQSFAAPRLFRMVISDQALRGKSEEELVKTYHELEDSDPAYASLQVLPLSFPDELREKMLKHRSFYQLPSNKKRWAQETQNVLRGEFLIRKAHERAQRKAESNALFERIKNRKKEPFEYENNMLQKYAQVEYLPSLKRYTHQLGTPADIASRNFDLISQSVGGKVSRVTSLFHFLLSHESEWFLSDADNVSLDLRKRKFAEWLTTRELVSHPGAETNIAKSLFFWTSQYADFLRDSAGAEILQGGRFHSQSEEVEILKTIDAEGNEVMLGKTKEEVHRDGDLHETVQIYVFDDENRLMLQKRSMNRTISPGKYQVSVSGHVAITDSDLLKAAEREFEEEFGIPMAAERFVQVTRNNEIVRSMMSDTVKNNEATTIYLVRLSKEEKERVRQNYNLHELDLIESLPLEVFEQKFKENPSNYSNSLNHLMTQNGGVYERLKTALAVEKIVRENPRTNGFGKIRGNKLVGLVSQLVVDWQRIKDSGALFFDMQKTLVARKQDATPEMVELFAWLLSQDIRVAISSGNTEDEVQDQVVRLVREKLKEEGRISKLKNLTVYANTGTYKNTYDRLGRRRPEAAYRNQFAISTHVERALQQSLEEIAEQHQFFLTPELFESFRAVYAKDKALGEQVDEFLFPWMEGQAYSPAILESASAMQGKVISPYIVKRGVNEKGEAFTMAIQKFLGEHRMPVVDAIIEKMRAQIGDEVDAYSIATGGSTTINFLNAAANKAFSLYDYVQSERKAGRTLDPRYIYFHGDEVFYDEETGNEGNDVITLRAPLLEEADKEELKQIQVVAVNPRPPIGLTPAQQARVHYLSGEEKGTTLLLSVLKEVLQNQSTSRSEARKPSRRSSFRVPLTESDFEQLQKKRVEEAARAERILKLFSPAEDALSRKDRRNLEKLSDPGYHLGDLKRSFLRVVIREFHQKRKDRARGEYRLDNLSQVERWVLYRVFETGWTTDVTPFSRWHQLQNRSSLLASKLEPGSRRLRDTLEKKLLDKVKDPTPIVQEWLDIRSQSTIRRWIRNAIPVVEKVLADEFPHLNINPRPLSRSEMREDDAFFEESFDMHLRKDEDGWIFELGDYSFYMDFAGDDAEEFYDIYEFDEELGEWDAEPLDPGEPSTQFMETFFKEVARPYFDQLGGIFLGRAKPTLNVEYLSDMIEIREWDGKRISRLVFDRPTPYSVNTQEKEIAWTQENETEEARKKTLLFFAALPLVMHEKTRASALRLILNDEDQSYSSLVNQLIDLHATARSEMREGVDEDALKKYGAQYFELSTTGDVQPLGEAIERNYRLSKDAAKFDHPNFNGGLAVIQITGDRFKLVLGRGEVGEAPVRYVDHLDLAKAANLHHSERINLGFWFDSTEDRLKSISFVPVLGEEPFDAEKVVRVARLMRDALKDFRANDFARMDFSFPLLVVDALRLKFSRDFSTRGTKVEAVADLLLESEKRSEARVLSEDDPLDLRLIPESALRVSEAFAVSFENPFTPGQVLDLSFAPNTQKFFVGSYRVRGEGDQVYGDLSFSVSDRVLEVTKFYPYDPAPSEVLQTTKIPQAIFAWYVYLAKQLNLKIRIATTGSPQLVHIARKFLDDISYATGGGLRPIAPNKTMAEIYKEVGAIILQDPQDPNRSGYIVVEPLNGDFYQVTSQHGIGPAHDTVIQINEQGKILDQQGAPLPLEMLSFSSSIYLIGNPNLILDLKAANRSEMRDASFGDLEVFDPTKLIGRSESREQRTARDEIDLKLMYLDRHFAAADVLVRDHGKISFEVVDTLGSDIDEIEYLLIRYENNFGDKDQNLQSLKDKVRSFDLRHILLTNYVAGRSEAREVDELYREVLTKAPFVAEREGLGRLVNAYAAVQWIKQEYSTQSRQILDRLAGRLFQLSLAVYGADFLAARIDGRFVEWSQRLGESPDGKFFYFLIGSGNSLDAYIYGRENIQEKTAFVSSFVTRSKLDGKEGRGSFLLDYTNHRFKTRGVTSRVAFPLSGNATKIKSYYANRGIKDVQMQANVFEINPQDLTNLNADGFLDPSDIQSPPRSEAREVAGERMVPQIRRTAETLRKAGLPYKVGVPYPISPQHRSLIEQVDFASRPEVKSEFPILILNFDPHHDAYAGVDTSASWARTVTSREQAQVITVLPNLVGGFGESGRLTPPLATLDFIDFSEFHAKEDLRGQFKELRDIELKVRGTTYALKDYPGPIWLSLDYDFFSLGEMRGTKIYEIDAEDLTEQFEYLARYFKDNNIRLQEILGYQSPSYLVQGEGRERWMAAADLRFHHLRKEFFYSTKEMQQGLHLRDSDVRSEARAQKETAELVSQSSGNSRNSKVFFREDVKSIPSSNNRLNESVLRPAAAGLRSETAPPGFEPGLTSSRKKHSIQLSYGADQDANTTQILNINQQKNEINEINGFRSESRGEESWDEILEWNRGAFSRAVESGTISPEQERNLNQVFVSLSELVESVARQIHERLRGELGIDPGKVEISLVGGRLKQKEISIHRGMHMSEHSDIDVNVDLENSDDSIDFENRLEVSAVITKLFYEELENLALPARLGMSNTRDAVSVDPPQENARAVHAFYQAMVSGGINLPEHLRKYLDYPKIDIFITDNKNQRLNLTTEPRLSLTTAQQQTRSESREKEISLSSTAESSRGSGDRVIPEPEAVEPTLRSEARVDLSKYSRVAAFLENVELANEILERTDEPRRSLILKSYEVIESLEGSRYGDQSVLTVLLPIVYDALRDNKPVTEAIENALSDLDEYADQSWIQPAGIELEIWRSSFDSKLSDEEIERLYQDLSALYLLGYYPDIFDHDLRSNFKPAWSLNYSSAKYLEIRTRPLRSSKSLVYLQHRLAQDFSELPQLDYYRTHLNIQLDESIEWTDEIEQLKKDITTEVARPILLFSSSEGRFQEYRQYLNTRRGSMAVPPLFWPPVKFKAFDEKLMIPERIEIRVFGNNPSDEIQMFEALQRGQVLASLRIAKTLEDLELSAGKAVLAWQKFVNDSKKIRAEHFPEQFGVVLQTKEWNDLEGRRRSNYGVELNELMDRTLGDLLSFRSEARQLEETSVKKQVMSVAEIDAVVTVADKVTNRIVRLQDRVEAVLQKLLPNLYAAPEKTQISLMSEEERARVVDFFAREMKEGRQIVIPADLLLASARNERGSLDQKMLDEFFSGILEAASQLREIPKDPIVYFTGDVTQEVKRALFNRHSERSEESGPEILRFAQDDVKRIFETEIADAHQIGRSLQAKAGNAAVAVSSESDTTLNLAAFFIEASAVASINTPSNRLSFLNNLTGLLLTAATLNQKEVEALLRELDIPFEPGKYPGLTAQAFLAEAFQEKLATAAIARSA